MRPVGFTRSIIVQEKFYKIAPVFRSLEICSLDRQAQGWHVFGVELRPREWLDVALQQQVLAAGCIEHRCSVQTTPLAPPSRIGYRTLSQRIEAYAREPSD